MEQVGSVVVEERQPILEQQVVVVVLDTLILIIAKIILLPVAKEANLISDSQLHMTQKTEELLETQINMVR